MTDNTRALLEQAQKQLDAGNSICSASSWHKAIRAELAKPVEHKKMLVDQDDMWMLVIQNQSMALEIIKLRSESPAWVSVKEKMPDMPPDAEGFPSSCVVLICCLDGYIGTARAAIYDDKVEWYSDDDYKNSYVTHWMPLPAGPIPHDKEGGAA